MPYYTVLEAELKYLNNSYTYHKPNSDQPERYISIRDTALNFGGIIIRCCPPSRERSLALTNLEQVVMWANKAIACNEPEEN